MYETWDRRVLNKMYSLAKEQQRSEKPGYVVRTYNDSKQCMTSSSMDL